MKKATLNFQKVAGIAFFILAVTLIIIEPSTIKNPISIDYDKKTFSGTLPVIALIVAAVFFWFGTREKEDELEEAKSALKDAADKLGGKIVTLSFRFGPDDKQEHLKKCYRS